MGVYYDRNGILVADTLDELHAFASRLGLKRKWFQKNDDHPHYDLTTTQARQRASRCGAILIEPREIGEKSKLLLIRKTEMQIVIGVMSIDNGFRELGRFDYQPGQINVPEQFMQFHRDKVNEDPVNAPGYGMESAPDELNVGYIRMMKGTELFDEVVVSKSYVMKIFDTMSHGYKMRKIISDGYGGIMPETMEIVDRREHPKAKALQENKLLGIGKPKKVKR